MIRFVLMWALIALSLTVGIARAEQPQPQPPEMSGMIEWETSPDRNILVTTPFYQFKYVIKFSEPAPECARVRRAGNEITWITGDIRMPYRYVTHAVPEMLKENLDSEWIMYVLETKY